MVRWVRQLRPAADPKRFIPPTENQIRYAQSLKIAIPPNADKSELSRLLTEAEMKFPLYVPGEDSELDEQIRQEDKEERRQEEAERPWKEYGNANKFMLVIFSRGKATVVEVVRIWTPEWQSGTRWVIRWEKQWSR